MQYSSFYGGKPGINPVIIAHYNSIEEMTEYFHQGGNYNVVGYGLYVIIDTAIENGEYSNPQNGIVYRRGMDYNDLPKTAPAEPEYQETGHESETVDQFKQRYETWLKTTFKQYALSPGAGAVYVGKIVGPRGITAALNIVDYTEESESYEVSSLGLGSSTNDRVKYQYYNVKDDKGNITEYQVAFAIPGYGLHISAEPDSPYIADGTELATKDDNNSGDFYSKWEIKVPRGKHGDDADIYIKDGNDHHDIDDSHCDDQHFWKKITSYENSTPSETWTKLEPYKVIKNITEKIDGSNSTPWTSRHSYELLKYGSDNIYSEGTHASLTNLGNNLCLLCIKEGFINVSDLPNDLSTLCEGYLFKCASGAKFRVVQDTFQPANRLIVDYTYDPDETFHVNYLDDIQLDDDGLLWGKYSNISNRLRIGTIKDIRLVKFCKNASEITSSINKPINKFYIIYNTYKKNASGNIQIDKDFKSNGSYPTTDSTGRMIEWINQPIKFIDSIRRDSATGKVYIKYSTDASEQLFYDAMKSITKAELDANNYIKFTWDTGDTQTLGLKIKSANSIYILNKGDLSKLQSFHANYKVGAHNTDGTPSVNGIGDDELISDNLNYIVDAKLNGDNLCILWSSPSYRNGLTNYYNLSYNGTQYRYQNLGPILSGLHIIGNFSSLAALQTAYPNGFGTNSTTENRAGWIATVSYTDSTTGKPVTLLYAYDYIGSLGWYMIYNLADSSIRPLTVVIADYADANDLTKPASGGGSLQNKGLWFVIEKAPTQEQEYDIATSQSIVNLFA